MDYEIAKRIPLEVEDVFLKKNGVATINSIYHCLRYLELEAQRVGMPVVANLIEAAATGIRDVNRVQTNDP